MILALKTDNPEATVTLLNKNGEVLDTYSWQAHRTLAKDLLKVINGRLQANGANWQAIEGVILFKGPGSFTGLRIGAAIANTLAHSERIPIVGAQGGSWMQSGVEQLRAQSNDLLVVPEYGSEANITKPRK